MSANVTSLQAHMMEKAQKRQALIEAHGEPQWTFALQLAASMLSQPDDWEAGRHNFTHKPSGTDVWIANGMRSVAIGGPANVSGDNCFSDDEKAMLWRAYHRWLGRPSGTFGDLSESALYDALALMPAKPVQKAIDKARPILTHPAVWAASLAGATTFGALLW